MSVFNSFLFLYDNDSDRFGFIDELPKMTPTSQNKPSSPVILFFASITWDSFTKADTNSLVTIQYLRTYLNAGRAKVYLCGHKDEPFGTIDSLWEYPLRHISIPEFFMKSFKPNELDPSKCQALLRKYQQPYKDLAAAIAIVVAVAVSILSVAVLVMVSLLSRPLLLLLLLLLL